MPISEVASRLEHNEGAAAIIVLTAGFGEAISAALANATAEKNWRAQSATRKCSMTLATVDPGEALCGFLFFDLCPKKVCSDGRFTAHLKIRRMPRSTGVPLDFVVAFSFEEWKKEKRR